MQKKQKKIIIIGASSGIGRELALKFAEKGCMVGVAARRKNLLKEVKKEFPNNIFIEQININNRDLATARIKRLADKIGGLDIFIHSTGIGNRNNALEYGIEKDIITTNILGFTSIITFAFKYFKKQGFGQIAAITSVAGLRGNRFSPSYGASKAFQINYMEALRANSKKQELNINITEIRPGFVKTKMAKGPGVFWDCTAEKAARQIYAALMKKKSVVYVSRRWKYVGLLIKALPEFIVNKI